MFCRKCGNQISDTAAFCPKCGTPTASTQQQPMNTPPSQPMLQPSASFTPQANSGTVVLRRETDKNKVIRDIIFHMIFNFFVGAALVFVLVWITVGLDTISAIPGFYKVVIRTGFFCAAFSAIPKVIVIALRIKDPTDTAYEIGSVQDEKTNQEFENKYRKFESVVEWVTVIAIIAFSGYSFYLEYREAYPDEVQQLTDTIQNIIDGDDSSSGSSSSVSTEDGPLSPTTYFVEDTDDRPAIIILEPDGTCAYFMRYATADAYHYGYYDETANGIMIHVTLNEGTTLDIPFSLNGDTLVSTLTEVVLTYPGAVFYRSADVPADVLSHPPYQASDIPISVTVQEALVMLDEFIMTIPNTESEDIEYLGIISVDGRNYYQFTAPLFERLDDGRGDRIVVDVLSGTLAAIHQDDGSDFSNAYMALEEWFTGSYWGDPWTGDIFAIG